MSNVWKRIAAVAAVSLGLVTAQSPPPFAGRGPGGGPNAQNRLDFLATYLGLSDTQKAQAKTIFDNEAQAAQALRDPLKAAHDALQSAVKANKSDAELDQLSAAVGTLDGQLTAIHAKAQAKFYALLTPDQRDKLDQMPGPGRGMYRMGRF